MDELLDTAARVVGLYAPDGRQVGFARVVSDFHTVSYLADVYVLEEVRGRGFGIELVRFTVDGGTLGHTKWILHTRDMHRLYAKLGFVPPGERTMERAKLWSADPGPIEAGRHHAHSALGELHASARRSRTCSRVREIEIRSCASESRSRIVIVSSSSVWSSIVSAKGVPISSWRR